jgi:hypothetical protein
MITHLQSLVRRSQKHLGVNLGDTETWESFDTQPDSLSL